ncbi:DNA topoisomerase 3-alpha [Dipsacomyces acuminosporus]|nr:DNA topoisomerase 3-alpha [Dipsacomyces acuminosporus]
MRILCVAEKPSQAKSIVQILSQGQSNSRAGKNKYNRNFDFQYRINGAFVQVTMTSVAGHVMEIDFPTAMRKWHSCNPVALFTAPIVRAVPESCKEVAVNIKQEARSATHLYIWTDCDREGEGIGSEIMALCHEVNPRIIVKRAHFSSVLPQEIHHAMQNPRELDMRLVYAVEARSELDLRIGSALTRFQTLRLQSRFAAVKDKMLSYGPCQFPTLGFVVEQFLRVDSFVPEDYWYIFLQHEKDDGRATFSWKRHRLFDQEACFALYATCMASPTAKVVSVRSRPKEKWRPLPLTTVELQKCCARFLRLAPDSIMSIAEGLYNQGFISYPRTETDMFDRNMDLKGIVSKLTQYQPFSGYAQHLANGEFKWPRQGRNNDKAHPPIHPVAPANNLTGDAKRVYEFVTRRFLACCSDNAKGQATEVDVQIANEHFSTNGLMIIARNYLDIYPYDKWSESTVPLYRQGDSFQPTALEIRTSTTTEPKLLTYDRLIDIMDKNGIGTDATHADHIKKIMDREYIFKIDGELLTPSRLGIGLVQGYDDIGLELSLSKPHLRREMEIELKQICEGTKNKDQVLDQSISLYKAVYTKSVAEVEKLEQVLGQYLEEAPIADNSAAWVPPSGVNGNGGDSDVVCRCPHCSSGSFNLRTKANGGWMIGCDTYPQCKKAVWIPDIVSAISVSTEACSRCSSNPKGPAKLVEICFKPGSVPPGVPTRYQGCIRGCDEMINELFGVRPSQVQVQQRQGSHAQLFPASTIRSPSPSALAAGAAPGAPLAQYTMLAPSQPPPSRLTSNYHPQSGQQQPAGGADTSLSSSPLCLCGILSVHRTVAKEGANKGRPFFACSKSQDTQCDFFEWADQPAQSTSYSSSGGYNHSASSGGGSSGSSFGAGRFGDSAPLEKPKCKCGLFAALKQATKEGPNRGREYFVCTKTFQGCGFVCWRDEVGAYMSGASTSQQSNAANMTCFRCGNQGHWARDCPNGDGAYTAPGSGDTAGPVRRTRSKAKARGAGTRARGAGRARGGRAQNGASSSRSARAAAGSRAPDPDPDFGFWM